MNNLGGTRTILLNKMLKVDNATPAQRLKKLQEDRISNIRSYAREYKSRFGIVKAEHLDIGEEVYRVDWDYDAVYITKDIITGITMNKKIDSNYKKRVVTEYRTELVGTPSIEEGTFKTKEEAIHFAQFCTSGVYSSLPIIYSEEIGKTFVEEKEDESKE